MVSISPLGITLIELVQIPVSQIKEAVWIAYEDDIELMDKYHILPASHEDCVLMTVGLIEDASNEKPMENYNVLWNNVLIGYTCKYEDVLYSYGLNIAYRRKSILHDWWGAVEKMMGDNFKTYLYSNNSRAKDFLERNGLTTINEENNILELIKF